MHPRQGKGYLHCYKFPLTRRFTDCKERSEEHTSELQSLTNLVCRLLLEKKKILAEGKRLSTKNRPNFLYLLQTVSNYAPERLTPRFISVKLAAVPDRLCYAMDGTAEI